MNWYLVLAVLLLQWGCAYRSAAGDKTVVLPHPTPTAEISNANDAGLWPKITKAESTVDPEERKRLEAQNDKFREASDEFRSIDFKNFSFKNTEKGSNPSKTIRLKDGEYQYLDEKHAGGTDYSLGDVFYIDLTGDNKKEAVVFLYTVSCGASCSGAGATIYFFSIEGSKPKQLAAINTGCPSCGCDLKSFSIAQKEIRIEQFGCTDDESICKFCIADLTTTTYRLDKNKLRTISKQFVKTDIVDVMNYIASISISG